MINFEGKEYDIKIKSKEVFETSDGETYNVLPLAIKHEDHLAVVKEINEFLESIELKNVENYEYIVKDEPRMMDSGYKFYYIESEEMYDKFIETEKKRISLTTLNSAKFFNLVADDRKEQIKSYPTFLAYNKTRNTLITRDEIIHRIAVSNDFLQLCETLMEERKHDNAE